MHAGKVVQTGLLLGTWGDIQPHVRIMKTEKDVHWKNFAWTGISNRTHPLLSSCERENN